MWERPKIKIPLRSKDRKLEWVGMISILVLWLVALYAYVVLPDVTATHLNAAGEVDGYGNKTTFLGIAGLGTLLYVMITILNRYPHLFNYTDAITITNAKEKYTVATQLLRSLKVIIVIIFIVLISAFLIIGTRV